MNAVRIVELPVPAVDAAPTVEAHGWVEVVTQSLRAAVGHDDFVRPVETELRLYANQRTAHKQILLAVDGDGGPAGVLGYARIDLPVLDNTHLAEVEILVRPEARRHGVGTALWAELEARVRAAGRTVATTWTIHGQEAGADDPAVAARTGVGRLPGDDPGVRFAQNHGFGLEQTERQSTLAVPVDAALLDRLRADAEEVAGPAYRLVQWRDTTPERWLAPMAVLQARMSTDAPVAGLDWAEEAWDEQRVRDTDAENALGGGGYLLSGAEHVPSRELVAFTMIHYVPSQPEVAFQHNTLVRADHRGHRLGMLVKAANLQVLAGEVPSVRRVRTWNAGENRHMLAINETLGFAPACVEGAWQRRLG